MSPDWIHGRFAHVPVQKVFAPLSAAGRSERVGPLI